MVTCSVLIPAYNGEKFLRRALDSVLSQTYKDFEVILIDDGSTDTTPQICDEYGENYTFIRVYHQKNMGFTKTSERLIEKAHGEYIFWLYQDDYFDSKLLEKAVNAFHDNDADIVAWGRNEIRKNGIQGINPIEDLGIKQWKEMTAWGTHPQMSMYAIRRNLWTKRDEFPDDVEWTEDLWTTSQIVPKAKSIVSLGELLYFYDLTNNESITHSYRASRLCREGLTFYRIIKKNLEKRPGKVPPNLDYIRKYLVNAYCINQVSPSLSKKQIDSIKLALKELVNLFPQKKTKKFYLIQICIIHGIDCICRWYGKGRIKRFTQSK